MNKHFKKSRNGTEKSSFESQKLVSVFEKLLENTKKFENISENKEQVVVSYNFWTQNQRLYACHADHSYKKIPAKIMNKCKTDKN